MAPSLVFALLLGLAAAAPLDETKTDKREKRTDIMPIMPITTMPSYMLLRNMDDKLCMEDGRCFFLLDGTHNMVYPFSSNIGTPLLFDEAGTPIKDVKPVEMPKPMEGKQDPLVPLLPPGSKAEKRPLMGLFNRDEPELMHATPLVMPWVVDADWKKLDPIAMPLFTGNYWWPSMTFLADEKQDKKPFEEVKTDGSFIGAVNPDIPMKDVTFNPAMLKEAREAPEQIRIARADILQIMKPELLGEKKDVVKPLEVGASLNVPLSGPAPGLLGIGNINPVEKPVAEVGEKIVEKITGSII